MIANIVVDNVAPWRTTYQSIFNLYKYSQYYEYSSPFGPCDCTEIIASSLRYFLISDRKSAICWSYVSDKSHAQQHIRLFSATEILYKDK